MTCRSSYYIYENLQYEHSMQAIAYVSLNPHLDSKCTKLVLGPGLDGPAAISPDPNSLARPNLYGNHLPKPWTAGH